MYLFKDQVKIKMHITYFINNCFKTNINKYYIILYNIYKLSTSPCKEHQSHICSFINLGSLVLATGEYTCDGKPYCVPIKGC